MTKRTRNDYLALRCQYQPKGVRLVVVAESPPDSGRYFTTQKARRANFSLPR
jgi:hypothetical protein